MNEEAISAKHLNGEKCHTCKGHFLVERESWVG